MMVHTQVWRRTDFLFNLFWHSALEAAIVKVLKEPPLVQVFNYAKLVSTE